MVWKVEIIRNKRLRLKCDVCGATKWILRRYWEKHMDLVKECCKLDELHSASIVVDREARYAREAAEEAERKKLKLLQEMDATPEPTEDLNKLRQEIENQKSTEIIVNPKKKNKR